MLFINLCTSGNHLFFSVVTQCYSPQMIGSLWITLNFLFTASSYHLLIIVSCTVVFAGVTGNEMSAMADDYKSINILKLYNKLSSARVLIGSQL